MPSDAAQRNADGLQLACRVLENAGAAAKLRAILDPARSSVVTLTSNGSEIGYAQLAHNPCDRHVAAAHLATDPARGAAYYCNWLSQRRSDPRGPVFLVAPAQLTVTSACEAEQWREHGNTWLKETLQKWAETPGNTFPDSLAGICKLQLPVSSAAARACAATRTHAAHHMLWTRPPTVHPADPGHFFLLLPTHPHYAKLSNSLFHLVSSAFAPPAPASALARIHARVAAAWAQWRGQPTWPDAFFRLCTELLPATALAAPGTLPCRILQYVAEDPAHRGRVIAAVQLCETRDSTVVWSLATAPSHRRRGLATLLLAHALSAQPAAQPVELLCSESMIPFYARSGFQASGEAVQLRHLALV